MINLVSIFNSLLNNFGLHVNKVEHKYPLDIRSESSNPLSMLYISKIQPIIIDAPINLGRGLPLFTFNKKGIHPYVKAIEACQVNSPLEHEKIISSVLKSYYQVMQPVNVSELLDLNQNNLSAYFQEPAWMTLMPWDNYIIDKWKFSYPETVLNENTRQGFKIGIEDGWSWVGPVSSKKLDVETKRLANVYKSILTNGYLRNNKVDGDIKTIVLVKKNNKWCWQSISGQHRVAVLSALDYKTVPIRVTKIIREEDVDIWPNVLSGLYTKEQALIIFNKVFNGENPSVAQNWIDTLRSLKYFDEV